MNITPFSFQKLFRITFVTLSCFLFSVALAQDLTLDEIIKKNIEAQGGYDLIKSIKNIHLEITIDVQGNNLTIHNYTIYDSVTKSEFEFAGQKGYAISSKKEGYAFNPFIGQTEPEKQTDDVIKLASSELDIQGHLVDYAQKGHQVELLGTEDVDGVECYKIKAKLNGSGKEMTEFIEKKTFLPIKTTNTFTINGKEMAESVKYSNYEKLPNGLVFAKVITSSQGIVKIAKIEVNNDFPPDFFAFPKVKPKETPQVKPKETPTKKPSKPKK